MLITPSHKSICNKTSSIAVAVLGLCVSMPVFASDSAANITALLEQINVLWITLAAILVFFMQAGFALLESGAVRSKNTVNVMMKNYLDMCMGGLIFYLIGFGLLMGNNVTGFIGLDHFAPDSLSNMDWAMLLFQTMFAATAVTIASGAMAERVHFGAYILASMIICAIIYPIYGSWVWGGYYGGAGWLASLGFIDFAGSTVVHSIGGWLALAGVLVLGPRLGRYDKEGNPHRIDGHNLSLVALGGFILWFGWFGFNAGSSLTVEANIGLIALNTQLAAGSAAVTGLLISWLRRKRVLLSEVVNISLTGLVAITAGCATMTPKFTILTGVIACFVYLSSSRLLQKLKIDDVVNASCVHGFGGAWGTLAAGMFYAGNLFNFQIIIVQLLGILVAFLWAFVLGLVMYLLIAKTIGLRASTLHQQRGLDYTEHDELGYPEFQKFIYDQSSK